MLRTLASVKPTGIQHHFDTPQMTKILSFDIGTRHLAYCCLHKTAQQTYIEKWSVVDLMGVPGTPYDEACVWVLSKSWKLNELKKYLEERHLSSVGKKAELVKRIHTDLKKRKIAKVTSTNLCVIASKMYAYLDNEPWMLECDIIVLENQPCLTNPVMKSVQMLLYGYFMYLGVWQTHKHNCQVLQVGGGDGDTECPQTAASPLPRVMLTSATNKLKVCEGELKNTPNPVDADVLPGDSGAHSLDATADAPESTSPGEGTGKPDSTSTKKKRNKYKQRKQDAIALTSNILKQWEDCLDEPLRKTAHSEWRALLEQSCTKEKDDLSDSFLQGLYVLHKHT